MQIAFIASLLELCREQNMTKASEKLCITQQGLSRQVQAIERELDVALFERSRNGVAPTEICERIRPHLERIQEEYDLVLKDIEAARHGEAEGSLSIAFAIGISHCLDTDFIFEYQKSHRELSIEIGEWSQPACIQKLLAGELDLAFLVNPDATGRFNAYPLAEDYMFAAIHRDHRLAAVDSPMEFSLLDGENIITGSPDNALKELFDRYCVLAGIAPRVIVSSSYSLAFVNAMTENVGIATVTTAMARRITNTDIVFRRLLAPEPGIMYCCTPLHAKRGRERAALLRYVRHYFETTPMPRFKED